MDEFLNFLNKFIGLISEKDLDDPAILSQLSQLVSILQTKPYPLPKELIEELSRIQNKIERFRTVAIRLKIKDDESLKHLAESMREVGLFKC